MTKHPASHTAFILVHPQMGENIGAAARAMANFGMADLRLVAPRDGWPNKRADSLAAGAFDGFIDVSVYDHLSDALADIHYAYATTARARDMDKPVFTPAAAMDDHTARGMRSAIVFGPERTGLEKDEVAQCHALINIPTSPDFSSLNLGQSVLLMAYALSQQSGTITQKDHPIAPLEQFNAFFDRLETAIDGKDFFKEAALRPKVLRNIRNTLLRAEMTEQEINTFHGILSALTGDRTKS